MNRERWEHVQALFHEASALVEPDRSAFLQAACRNDLDLLREVRAMLDAETGSRSILERNVDEIVAQILGAPGDSIVEQQFGPYRLVRMLGEGGMGVVWQARRVDAGNLVAIKFLPHAGLSPARRERFAREIRLLAKLQHPYIARLYDAGTLDDGTPWFVMEYVEGAIFAEYCRRSGLSIRQRLGLFRQVCEAVQYAHSQEIIHRDLKPSNILVTNDGTPRLLDFGIAREMQQLDDSGELTKAGLRFFSADYSAPEWVRDGSIGFSIDVYSLGVILYEMLTGQLPSAPRPGSDHGRGMADDFEAEKPSHVERRGQREVGIGDRLSTAAWNELDVLCLKALRRDPKERYPSVEALIRDIDHYLKHEPLEARPDTLVYRANRFFRRNRAAVVATAATLLLIAGTITVYTLRLARARNAAVTEAAREKRIQDFMLELFEGGDPEAGPANDVSVVKLLDRGTQEARNLGSEPEVQADLNQTLGTMYRKLGRFREADGPLQEALKEREGLGHPDQGATADNLIALAQLRSDQGRWKEGEGLVRQAESLIRRYTPRDALHLANAESALGKIYAAGGRQAEAVNVLKRAMAAQSAHGASDADLSQSVNALADAEVYLGHLGDANALFQRALTLDQRAFGPNHPLVASNLEDLAAIQEEWENYPEAEKLERQALSITEAWYGDDHPDTARNLTGLASTLEYENHVAEAGAMLRRALEISEHAYGSDHPRVAFILNRLAAIAMDQSDFAEAEKDFSRVIEIYRSAFGKGDYRVAVVQSNLASVYFKEKKDSAAEQLFRTAIQGENTALEPNSIETGESEVKLGRVLRFEKSYREAAEHSLIGLNTMLKQPTPPASYVNGARKDLVLDYQALNQPQEAAKYEHADTGAH